MGTPEHRPSLNIQQDLCYEDSVQVGSPNKHLDRAAGGWSGGLEPVQTPGPGSDPRCVCNNNQSLRPRQAAPLRRRFHEQLTWEVLK